MGIFFWGIPLWEFLLHVSWPAEISFADRCLLGYHTIVAWGLKGSVNEELCHGCWLRNGKLYSRLCIGFGPGSLWQSAKDLKKLQTSNCKPRSPEDQSRRSLCSQWDEAGNLGPSLPRLRFQQGSQPTMVPVTLEQPLAPNSSLDLPGPSSCQRFLDCAASGSLEGLEPKAILPQKGV